MPQGFWGVAILSTVHGILLARPLHTRLTSRFIGGTALGFGGRCMWYTDDGRQAVGSTVHGGTEVEPDALSNRLRQGENLHTEFKTWPLQADEMAATIIAFANTDGGDIFLGVDDNGQVVGLDETGVDRMAQFIDNVAFNNCAPPVTLVQETLRDDQGRVILAVRIPKGSQRPYRTNRDVYYIRTTSGRRQASREELLRLFQATESLYYDETPILRSGLTISTSGRLPISWTTSKAMGSMWRAFPAAGYGATGVCCGMLEKSST